MTSPTSEFSYPPPQTYDAFYKDILISHLSTQVKTDIKAKLSPAQQEQIDLKQIEYTQAVISFINEKIFELSKFATNLLASEVSNEQSLVDGHDDLTNNSIAVTASRSSIIDDSRDLPSPTISSSASSITSAESPVPLKSSLVKTNGKKTSFDKSQRDPHGSSRKKKVMFSGKDEITIVPSIQDLTRQHDEQGVDKEVDTGLVSATISESATETIATTSKAVAYEGDYYDDDDDLYNAGPSPQVFSSPLYSDSSFSSGLESMEGSPLESAPITTYISTTVVETNTDMTDPVSPVISSLTHSENNDTKQSKLSSVADSTAQVDQALERKDSLDTITTGTSPKSPLGSPATATTISKIETQSPNITTVPSFNRESSSSEDEQPSDYPQDDDDDDFDDDEMFQFDETLGVDSGPKKDNTLEEVKDLSSPYMNLSRFNVPSYQASLPTDYEFPSIAASLPSNQSRTSLSHLPTVVGSLRPKKFTKYKPSSGHKTGDQNDLSNTNTDNANSESSQSSFNAGNQTSADLFSKRDFATPSQQINDRVIGGISSSRVMASQLSSMNAGASSSFGGAGGPSYFAGSLPIQITRDQRAWGQFSNRRHPATITEDNEAEEGQHPVGSITRTSSFVPRHKRPDGKMLSTDGAEQELIALGSLVNNNSFTSDVRDNPPLDDEDILMLASPSSAAQLMNPAGLDPEQMSFSQRLIWERRSSRGKM